MIKYAIAITLAACTVDPSDVRSCTPSTCPTDPGDPDPAPTPTPIEACVAESLATCAALGYPHNTTCQLAFGCHCSAEYEQLANNWCLYHSAYCIDGCPIWR